jgi:hypothetical protein
MIIVILLIDAAWPPIHKQFPRLFGWVILDECKNGTPRSSSLPVPDVRHRRAVDLLAAAGVFELPHLPTIGLEDRFEGEAGCRTMRME